MKTIKSEMKNLLYEIKDRLRNAEKKSSECEIIREVKVTTTMRCHCAHQNSDN
jgi:ribosomal protein S20